MNAHTQTPYKLQQTRKDKLDAGRVGLIPMFAHFIISIGGIMSMLEGGALLPLNLLPTRWEEMKEKNINLKILRLFP